MLSISYIQLDSEIILIVDGKTDLGDLPDITNKLLSSRGGNVLERKIKQVLCRRRSPDNDKCGRDEEGWHFEIVRLGLSHLGLCQQGQPGEDPDVDGLYNNKESQHMIYFLDLSFQLKNFTFFL